MYFVFSLQKQQVINYLILNDFDFLWAVLFERYHDDVYAL